MALAGCSAAPSQNILGSYFPSWMLCAVGGIFAATLVRVGFTTIGIDKDIPVPLLVYLSLSCLFAFAGWLVWLG
jgi:asparagine N-glycosylation enzyme membrane subunit Stt3